MTSHFPSEFRTRVPDCCVSPEFQHEGDFSFREAWMHLTDEYPIKYEGDRLPPPVVADLNGDGKKEVLVATHDAKILVIWSPVPHLICISNPACFLME